MKLPKSHLRFFAAMFATLGCGVGWAVSAGATTSYLDWQSKPDSAPAASDVQGASYPVPPSPYGQIGDPFVHTLRWPTKATGSQSSEQSSGQSSGQAPAQSAQNGIATPTATVRAAPIRTAQMASVEAPAPTQPQPATVMALPRPAPASANTVNHPDPGLADDPGMAEDAPIIGGAQTQPVADNLAPVPAPVNPAMAAAPPATPRIETAAAMPAPPAVEPPATVSAQTSTGQTRQVPAGPTKDDQSSLFDGGFQVPANSPYAARIAAARAAASQSGQPAPASHVPAPQVPAPQVASTKTAPAAPAPPLTQIPVQTPAQIPAQTAAAPAVLASADRPFVPGEHYTDASEAPRFYSLHREYGYRPDPISVDDNATGALLTLTPDKTASDSSGDTADASGSPSTDQKDATPATNP